MTQYSFYRSDVGGSIIIRERKPDGALSSEVYAQIWLAPTEGPALQQIFYGVHYSEMFAVGSGIIEVDENDNGRIL